MQTKHRGNFMLIKDFKPSFSREDQIQYIRDNKDDLVGFSNLTYSKSFI